VDPESVRAIVPAADKFHSSETTQTTTSIQPKNVYVNDDPDDDAISHNYLFNRFYAIHYKPPTVMLFIYEQTPTHTHTHATQLKPTAKRSKIESAFYCFLKFDNHRWSRIELS